MRNERNATRKVYSTRKVKLEKSVIWKKVQHEMSAT